MDMLTQIVALTNMIVLLVIHIKAERRAAEAHKWQRRKEEQQSTT